LVLASACGGKAPEQQAAVRDTFPVPAWAGDAIWYQIFVERFRNGDPRNDPTPADIVDPVARPLPANWRVTPWGHDWYALDPWARAADLGFYDAVYFRRYGGDLQGVLDRLDYLQDLGVTALYLNPINDAPSLHKYDARHYHHVDRNFGPDPRGDERRIAAEDPTDPATWTWTAADSLFLRLVQELHRRGMKVILDYSWNHTGTAFWAWQDVLQHQRQSRFADWYEVAAFDDPATADTNEFRYRGWLGVRSLPEWKKEGRARGLTQGPIEGTLVAPVREHVFAVTRRWMDPNGDGDPSDGVDGFRLDVAEQVPLGFWRDYRAFVRGINPEAYLLGEVWYEQWPDRIYDPAPWLQGDVFDAVMHYRWFVPTRAFFLGTDTALTPSTYATRLDSLGAGIRPPFMRAMMNLTASHDTPRFGTALFNAGKWKFHHNPREDSTYRVNRPDERVRRIQEQILVQQFTWVGAPHVWYGDEVGMWGGDDPDPRKPMVWADLRYEDETAHPSGRARPRDRVSPDLALRRVYRDLIALRTSELRLFVDGDVQWLVTDDAMGLLAYARTLGDRQAIVAFNADDRAHEINIEAQGTYRSAYPAGRPVTAINGMLRVQLPARTSRVWIRP
jgi:glycosidase